MLADVDVFGLDWTHYVIPSPNSILDHYVETAVYNVILYKMHDLD